MNMGAAVSVASLGSGCSREAIANEASTTNNADTPLPSHKIQGDKKMKCAVVYFSWSGNTRFAAETIAKKAGADLFEIKAETPYTSDFQKCCDEAKPECQGKTLRPIKTIEGLDLAKYDLVFVGSPNWWGTMAPPVRTWVTQSKDALKGKKVCLFQTHGGGGMQRVGKDFAETIGDTANVLPPKAFSGSSIKSSVPALEAFADATLAACGIAAVDATVYRFSVKDRKGADVPLEQYRGKVLLVVNTATRCGFTPQYEGLEAMYERLKGDGFELLDFPCNQFGQQAPGTDEEIHGFCVLNYKTAFPQFAKVEVNGENAAPLFKFLVAGTKFEGFPPDGKIAPILEKMLGEADPDYAKKPDIKWNFTKFLIGKDGRIVRRFEPTAPLADVESAIRAELAR